MRRSLRYFLMLIPVLMLALMAGCSGTPEEERAPAPPDIRLGNLRAGTGEAASRTIRATNLPEDVAEIQFSVSTVRSSLPEFSITRMGAPSPAILITADSGPSVSSMSVNAPEGETFGPGSVDLATVAFAATDSIVRRTPVIIEDAVAVMADGRRVELAAEPASYAVSLISDPLILFSFLACVVAAVYGLAQLPALANFFKYAPPLIWMYFVPMFTTTIGITPDANQLFSFMLVFFLPAVLVVLLLPSDVTAIRRLGPRALFMMAFATTGIVVGGIVSFWIFHTFFGDQLHPEAWKGVAALSGSWIGGGANMVAIVQSIGTPPNIIGPLVIADTVIAYTWLGILLTLKNYQDKIDKRHRAHTEAVDEISAKLLEEQTTNARAPRTPDIAWILGIALLVSTFSMWLGGPLFEFMNRIPYISAANSVINPFGWGILLITAITLALSATPARKLDHCGASSIGYVGLYLVLTTFGAQANLAAIFDVPLFFGIGILWVLIHIAFLYVGIRVLRAPLFLGATSSMANMGGPASAPVVAASYNQSMAPIGLLMAILGATIGTPLAFFVAFVCQRIAGG